MKAARLWFLATQCLLLAVEASATSPCLERTLAEAVDGNAVVVLGKVLSRSRASLDGQPVCLANAVRGLYRIQLIEEFEGKGSEEYFALADMPLPPLPPGEIYLTEPIVFDVDATYLFFAWGEPLRIDPCATVPESQAGEELSALRRTRPSKTTHGRKEGGLTMRQADGGTSLDKVDTSV